jgi:hypothetical protein
MRFGRRHFENDHHVEIRLARLKTVGYGASVHDEGMEVFTEHGLRFSSEARIKTQSFSNAYSGDIT